MPRKKKPAKKRQTKKRPSRNGQLIRALSILKDLLYKKRPVTFDQLVVRYGVHPKTIRRDLKALEGAGFKIKRTDKKGGG